MAEARIFISHSSHDKAFALRLAAKLKQPGISPWIDSEQIISGEDILDELGRGLATMDLLVLLASRHALESEWVNREVKFAQFREIEEKKALVLVYILDETSPKKLPWFLHHKNAARISSNDDGAELIVLDIRKSLARRQSPGQQQIEIAGFKPSPEVERLIRDVGIGDWDNAHRSALSIHAFTQPSGSNELFEPLLNYVDHPTDDNIRWSALHVIESLAQLSPWLFTRDVLFRLGQHSNFSVRSSAASLCMDFASYSPELVPTDLAMRLARYDEDWYVMSPATACLKALCSSRPILITHFLAFLRSEIPAEREYAARVFGEIAEKEPEILEPEELDAQISRLLGIGDKLAAGILAESLPSIKHAKRGSRYKYGL